MEPEEIDNLFKDRLGRMAPTPSADLWSRLQDRVNAEMPQAQPELKLEPQHEEKRRFGFLYYSIAAAIALLLAVGVVLKFQNPQATIDNQTIAQANVTKDATQPAEPTIAATETITEPAPTIAAVTTPDETIVAPETTPAIVAKAEKRHSVKAAGKPRKTTGDHWVKVQTTKQPAAMLAQQTVKQEKPAQQQEMPVAMQTPVAFASVTSAEPVEITIKRTVGQEAVAMAAADEPEQTSSFERKQRLAKNIFKQVKNLSNGEKINLHEVGLSADRIALETKIGKQKISKVINL
ncbi:hypothetical protein [Pontibacter fetidus]|uniref:Uncharacterized protein n=1 Tax=Pontibacter fetidus TaxID=2700082 RepID=A0A6B2GWT1_9BACT|nr:hypothetical protein [Pontibacter fetidus]NDK54441.1 hypothetical protein [Pontibacter fetidus]